jgi:hypothetical protein
MSAAADQMQTCELDMFLVGDVCAQKANLSYGSLGDNL